VRDPQPPQPVPAARVAPRPFVLVAEPDQRRASLYDELVEVRGYRSVVTRNGDEARAMLQRRHVPALLVANLSLPRLDGFSLLAEFRRVTGQVGPPALAIATSPELRAAAWNLKDRLGIIEVISSDADPDQVSDVLSRLLPQVSTDPPTASAASVDRRELDNRWMAETLDRFAAEAARRFDVRLALVSVTCGEREWFRLHVNPVSRPIEDRASPRSWSLIRQITESGEPLVVPDLRQHPVFAFDAFPPAGTLRGYAGVPVGVDSGNVSGALCLLDTDPLMLDARGLDALADTAHRLAMELEAAFERVKGEQRYTALTRLALTDPITGLANRRGGEAAFAREVSRARRSALPLSIVMIDIDHFKTINDRAGHPTGDRVLAGISEILAASQRGSDLAIRWGGEEFLVLLPGVGFAGACVFAERVRESVEQMTIREAGPITVSAGVAELHKDEEGAATLRRADASLYRAKEAGRNCVRCDEDTPRIEPAWLPVEP
jgi:diguanylate cyclase (GGDEF)-like protein